MMRRRRKKEIECPNCESRDYRVKKNYPFGKNKTKTLRDRKQGEPTKKVTLIKIKAKPIKTYICRRCGWRW